MKKAIQFLTYADYVTATNVLTKNSVFVSLHFEERQIICATSADLFNKICILNQYQIKNFIY